MSAQTEMCLFGKVFQDDTLEILGVVDTDESAKRIIRDRVIGYPPGAAESYHTRWIAGVSIIERHIRANSVSPSQATGYWYMYVPLVRMLATPVTTDPPPVAMPSQALLLEGQLRLVVAYFHETQHNSKTWSYNKCQYEPCASTMNLLRVLSGGENMRPPEVSIHDGANESADPGSPDVRPR